MIILINLKTSKNFILFVFDRDSKLIKIILEIIKISKEYRNNNSNRITKIFCNLFLDEFKHLLYDPNAKDTLMLDLFILNNEKFTKINTDGLDRYPNSIYQDILKIILDFNLTYDQIFSKNTFEEDEKPIGKYLIKF